MQSDTARHGLSSDEASELCERILGFAQADNTRINVFSGIRGFTRTAVNRVTTAGTSDDTTVRITSVFGKRVASADTNQFDDASLRSAVAQSEALARISPEDPEYLPELGAQVFREVDGYYDNTGDLTTESRARAASRAIDIVKEADSVAAGFIDVRAGSEAIATSNGLFGFHPSTNVASSLTVRTADGGSSDGPATKVRTGRRSIQNESPRTLSGNVRTGETRRHWSPASTTSFWSRQQ